MRAFLLLQKLHAIFAIVYVLCIYMYMYGQYLHLNIVVEVASLSKDLCCSPHKYDAAATSVNLFFLL